MPLAFGECFVGKHHESDRAVELIRTVGFQRVLIAGSLAILAFFAFGFQPLNAVSSTSVGGALAQGVVEPTALGALVPPEAETLVIDPTLEPPQQVAGTPMVYFDRAMVRTVSKDGSTGLTVASAGMSRPPAGALYAPLEVLNPSSSYGYRYSPLDGPGRRIPLGTGLRSRLRHARLRCRRRCGPGSRLAHLGRWQPGGNRARQRPGHHLQPPPGNRRHPGPIGAGRRGHCGGWDYGLVHGLPPPLRDDRQRPAHQPQRLDLPGHAAD